MSGVGRRSLQRDFPIFNLRNKKWDGRWRLVFYDIDEKSKRTRDRLQKKLKELGFGMIQKSVYLTPFDVAEDFREFLLEQGLSDFVFVGVVDRLFAGNEKKLIEKVWKLEDLNKRYLKLNERLEGGEVLDGIFSEFESLLREDPFLPKEFLPDSWRGDIVYQKIKQLLKR